MAGSSFGTIFRITTWGESHGKGIGVLADGVPAGLPLTEADIQPFLDRRRPGKSRFSTQRSEADQAEILSGTFEGRTTGTPVSILIRNTDQRSRDYSSISGIYRPGHADFGYDSKYGFRDYRGGGRSSGRETIGRVAGGAIAVLLLRELGITFTTYTRSIGPVSIGTFSPEEIGKNSLYMPDAEAASRAEAWLEERMAEEDSAGGVIECVISGMPAGVGEPVFEKLDASLAKAIMSIGAVKGVEIGDGFAAAQATGRTNNDPFTAAEDGRIIKSSNHAGGILGGISDGSDIIIRCAVKPTPSIASLQHTTDTGGHPADIRISGRHDPVIVPRAVVVVETMAAAAIADALMIGMSSRLDNLRRIWKP